RPRRSCTRASATTRSTTVRCTTAARPSPWRSWTWDRDSKRTSADLTPPETAPYPQGCRAVVVYTPAPRRPSAPSLRAVNPFTRYLAHRIVHVMSQDIVDASVSGLRGRLVSQDF